MTVPAQPTPEPDPSVPGAAPHPSPSRYSHTGTTRLLCAGPYLQARFRRRVVEELAEHDGRAVAPSVGVDVVPVLAHALRARRLELHAGGWIALLWVLFWLADLYGDEFGWMTSWSLADAYGQSYTERRFFLLTDAFDFFGGAQRYPGSGVWALNYALVSGLLWFVRNISGRGTSVYSLDGLLPGSGGRTWVVALVPRVLTALYWAAALAAVWNASANWMAVVFPLLMVIPVWRHRSAVEAVMCDRLPAETFRQRPREELTGPEWLREVGQAIDREQNSGIVLYEPARPFVGSGRALPSWSLVMDLRRRPEAGSEPLTAAGVLNCVRERLADLGRLPVPPSGLDRLRDVEIDELVYLPSGPPRHEVDHGETAAVTHRLASVGEGGEARRHFLRVRVSAWEHQVVVSVLVRVHTQGELLVLEVVPHVLDPLRPEFGLVDAVVERGRAYPAIAVARALLTAPAAGVAAAFSAARSLESTVRWAARSHGYVSARADSPEGASASVRELASVRGQSPFQRMDVSRYLKTIQERIGTGALQALSEKGHDTGQLEQQIVQVSNGGVFIGTMSGGAVATGRGARARADGALQQVIGRQDGR
ncbi:hypothetical protein GTW52_29605 [Streptomyces sp. SID8358]|uniref:hypothetical protein n=1 Tax=Streptomyces sp. SID8358 TaxID=2690342 RepID=UPI000DABF8E6|nr:hypothetical protein [Streptomyces sp. SID8358]MYU37223.1 hypothetical protein [Streptomyces sp. SID8358]